MTPHSGSTIPIPTSPDVERGNTSPGARGAALVRELYYFNSCILQQWLTHNFVQTNHESRYSPMKEQLLDVYLNVKEDDLEELDDQLKVALRNTVNNHVVPLVKFLSPDMTNVVRGNLERRNQLSSFPSFWMPDFSDPSEDGKLANLIVEKCGMGRSTPVEKATFWMRVRDKVKPIINNYRSNTANALKKNVLQGTFSCFIVSFFNAYN